MEKGGDRQATPLPEGVSASQRVPGRRARRLARGERERQIVDGSIRFFAEVGLHGDTRELARRLGITQSLLYKFFSSKQALIERVYQEVFLGRFNPYWEEVLDDRSLSPAERLTRFYRLYWRAIDDPLWIRIYLFAGLDGESLNRRYFELIRERIQPRVVAALREVAGMPDTTAVPMTPAEYEMVVGVHAELFYLGVRRWVYGFPIPEDLDGLIANRIAILIEGAPAVMKRL